MDLSEFNEKYLNKLNEQQRRAVTSDARAAAVLAVPGSGKTTTIVAKLGYQILVEGIRPASILTITYTNAATSDMAQRFECVFGEDVRRLYGSARPVFQTINSLCNGIIYTYSKMKDREPFELLSDRDASIAVREVLSAVDGGYPTESEVADLKQQISFVKNMAFSDPEIRERYKDADDFLRKYREYTRLLRENRRMDFDDQLVIAKAVLLRYPDVLARYQRRFPFICVDEAQDTSKIQHEIIRILAGNRCRLLMVGDEDQSIYGFRGAYPDALLNFGKAYPGAQIFPIEYNYRSLSGIVELANNCIRRNVNRTPKEMKAARRGGKGDEVVLIPVDSRISQYRKLIDIIESHDGEDVAILYRNNESSIPVVNYLDREGIPYRIRQFDASFFTHRVVTDICNTIRLAYDSQNAELFLDLYYKFGLRISKTEAINATRRSLALSCSPFQIIANDSYGDRKNNILSVLMDLNQIPREKGYRAIDRIVDSMGYRQFMEDRHLDTSKADTLKLIASTEESPQDLLDRLEELKIIISSDESTLPDEFSDHPVTLSTIHSSKGLEYDCVIILDAAEGVLPKMKKSSLKTAEDRAAYEEERRLYYVALTRARNKLYIMGYRSEASEFVLEQFGAALRKAPNRAKAPAAHSGAGTLDDYSSAFEVGSRVRHLKFGEGTVKGVYDGLIVVDFDDFGVKKLGLLIVRKNRLLQRI